LTEGEKSASGPTSLGRKLRQAAALGGWLAQFANQMPGRGDLNADWCDHVRPAGVLCWILVLGIGALALPANALLWLLGRAAAPPLTVAFVVTVGLLEAICGSMTVLLIVGWLVRFVPFEADRDQDVRSTEPPAEGSLTPAHATGIFGGNMGDTGRLTRYRHRQASIEYHSDQELRVRVKWHSAEASEPMTTTGYALLVPSNTGGVRRGTAHFAQGTCPAIELRWRHGPILLDFDDKEARDRVFAVLTGWAGGAIS
jgi:hypothetical protein